MRYQDGAIERDEVPDALLDDDIVVVRAATGAILGLGLYKKDEDFESELRMSLVHPSYRKQGVAMVMTTLALDDIEKASAGSDELPNVNITYALSDSGEALTAAVQSDFGDRFRFTIS